MAIRFSRLIRSGMQDTYTRTVAEIYMNTKSTAETMVFMSHKTGDTKAQVEARYIVDKHHVHVYMAEWDDRVYGDSAVLPEHIMHAIRLSDGFLLNVIPEIGKSMWIGYEIGGAHAMRKSRAKIMLEPVGNLPSVVDALRPLENRGELDRWISRILVSK